MPSYLYPDADEIKVFSQQPRRPFFDDSDALRLGYHLRMPDPPVRRLRSRPAKGSQDGIEEFYGTADSI